MNDLEMDVEVEAGIYEVSDEELEGQALHEASRGTMSPQTMCCDVPQ